MGSENKAKNKPPRSFSFETIFQSKEEKQQQATEQEQQDALDAFQEAFNTKLLADGQAILEKAVLEILTTGKIDSNKWSDSLELRDFETKYGLLAKSKLLVQIRSLNNNPPNLPPFQLYGIDKATGVGCYVDMNSDLDFDIASNTVFMYIIDKQGREHAIDLTELAQTNPQVKAFLDELCLYSTKTFNPLVLEETRANIQNNKDVQQFVQSRYARVLTAQMMRAWISYNASQILLNRLLIFKTEQYPKQIFPNDPEKQETILKAHMEREHELQRTQTEFEFSDDDIDEELPRATAKPTPLPQNAQSTSVPESKKQKENVADSFKHLLQSIFTSAVNFVFGVEIANIVLDIVGLNEPKPPKASKSMFTMFKHFTLSAISTNLGGGHLENVDSINSNMRPTQRK